MDRRNAITLGAAASLGGLMPARPDQQYFPPRSGVTPGPRNNIRARQVIIVGQGPPASGLLVYSPTIAAGNLVDSIAAASGKDGTPGNSVIRGIVNYLNLGSPVFAVALQDGSLLFFTAPTEAGPWTQQGVIATDSSNNIRIIPSGTGNTILGSGLTSGVPVVISGAESGGTPVADITNLGSAIAPIVRITANAVSDLFIGGRVSGDANSRIVIDTTTSGFPRIRFGPGNAAPDVNLTRPAANLLNVNAGDLDIATGGRGLQISEATANARMGRATLAGGTVTVNNNTITANTEVFLTCQTPGGTPGFLRVSARTAGTSFTILSSSATDTSVVAWLLVEPG